VAVLLIVVIAAQSFLNRQGQDPMAWFMDILITLPAILIGLSFHEFAHAFAADRLGDRTPKIQGRVTINPAAHIDPFGIIALIFIGFGWGKPVMVDNRNFKHIRRDGLIVDLAGVTMNLVLAIIFTGLLRLLINFQYDFMMNTSLGGIIIEMIFAIISINIVLMIFNLLPIPPLDGFGILTELFDLRKKEWYYQVYNNGFMILLALMIFNVTDKVLVPAVNFVYGIVMNIFF
jgi:Zn-dependent protease